MARDLDTGWLVSVPLPLARCKAAVGRGDAGRRGVEGHHVKKVVTPGRSGSRGDRSAGGARDQQAAGLFDRWR
jgi:hypothetical protein